MSTIKIVCTTTLLSLGLRTFYPDIYDATVKGFGFRIGFRTGLAACILLKYLGVDEWHWVMGIVLQLCSLVGVGIPLSDILADGKVRFGLATAPALKTEETSPFVMPSIGTEHDECEAIIKSSSNGLSKHAARANPNRRLEVAFGINSCFTSDSEPFCDRFRKRVETKLYVEEEEWVNHVEAALNVAKRELSGTANEVKLFDVVQMVTIKTMLMVLFDKDPADTTKDSYIRSLAKEVNRQWIRSKTGLDESDAPEWAFDQQKDLKDAAEQIFDKWDESNIHNPFNLILPGYETMWRVVLRCVIEVMSDRHLESSGDWKERLAAFLQKPTRDQLRQLNHQRVTVEHISLEALRVYPPTRRITRMYAEDDGSTRTVAADIEAMHHTAPTWQPDPLFFRPERWVDLKGVATKSYMPFGAKPFNCPAKRHDNPNVVPVPFGVSMLATLTGSLIEAMGDDWRLGANDFPSSEFPLTNNREDYSEACLYRINPTPENADTAEGGAAEQIDAAKRVDGGEENAGGTDDGVVQTSSDASQLVEAKQAQEAHEPSEVMGDEAAVEHRQSKEAKGVNAGETDGTEEAEAAKTDVETAAQVEAATEVGGFKEIAQVKKEVDKDEASHSGDEGESDGGEKEVASGDQQETEREVFDA